MYSLHSERFECEQKYTQPLQDLTIYSYLHFSTSLSICGVDFSCPTDHYDVVDAINLPDSVRVWRETFIHFGPIHFSNIHGDNVAK